MFILKILVGNSIKLSLSIIVLLLLPFKLSAQNEIQENDKYSPYELISGYYTNNFTPFKKGNIYTGLAFSLSDRNLTNVDRLFEKVISGDNLEFNILAKVGLYTGDYGMIGFNFEYIQDKFEGTTLRDSDTLQSQSITRGYYFTPNIRSSVPLSENERFSFFTEFGLTLGFSNGLTRLTKDMDDIEKVYLEEFKLRLGISPGITFFFVENFAFEIQLDLIGYELNINNKTVNNVEKSRDVRNNVDFNIDILSLQLGLAYYFGG